MKRNKIFLFLILCFSFTIPTPNVAEAQISKAIKKLKRSKAPNPRVKKLPPKVQGKKNGAQLLESAKRNKKTKSATSSRRRGVTKSKTVPGKAPTAKSTKNLAKLNNSAKPIVTTNSITHIKKRHWYNSTATNSGKFDKDIKTDSLKKMINSTVKEGDFYASTVKNQAHRTVFEYDLYRHIGVDKNKQPSTCLRVVLESNGTLVTAFPI